MRILVAFRSAPHRCPLRDLLRFSLRSHTNTQSKIQTRRHSRNPTSHAMRISSRATDFILQRENLYVEDGSLSDAISDIEDFFDTFRRIIERSSIFVHDPSHPLSLNRKITWRLQFSLKFPIRLLAILAEQWNITWSNPRIYPEHRYEEKTE